MAATKAGSPRWGWQAPQLNGLHVNVNYLHYRYSYINIYVGVLTPLTASLKPPEATNRLARGEPADMGDRSGRDA